MAKRSLVVSSLLVVAGVVYVGFGHPTPMGSPQASLYGHHEESRSSRREGWSRDHHSPPDFSRERWSPERARQQFEQRQRNEHRRHAFRRSEDRKIEDSDHEASENQENHAEGRPQSRDSRLPGSYASNATSPPSWYRDPAPSRLAGEPGILMPEPIRGQLKLDATQHQELDQIQQEMEGRLQKVLTPEQFAKLEQLREEFLDQELGTRQ